MPAISVETLTPIVGSRHLAAAGIAGDDLFVQFRKHDAPGPVYRYWCKPDGPQAPPTVHFAKLLGTNGDRGGRRATAYFDQMIRNQYAYERVSG